MTGAATPLREPARSRIKAEIAEYECPICQDRGVYITDGYNAAICKCEERKRIERLFKSSRITPAFRKKTFENFTTKFETPNKPQEVALMFECAKDYSDNLKDLKGEENNWMVLLGEPGAGKTHLAMAVANKAITEGEKVLYFPHLDGIEEMMGIINRAKQNSFYTSDEEPDTLNEKLQAMKDVDLLVWDDLFKQQQKGRKTPSYFEFKIAMQVLNHRYLNLKPTIVNSEYLPEELIDVDKALASRIIERAGGHMMVIEGMEANYRLFK